MSERTTISNHTYILPPDNYLHIEAGDTYKFIYCSYPISLPSFLHRIIPGGNIHKALMQQLNSTLDDEDILSSTKTFQSQFNKDAKKAIERVYEQQKSTSGKITREAMVRAVDDALQSSLKKSSAGEEIAAVKKTALTEALRHRVSSVALKSPSIPASLKASALTSDVKEKSTPESSVRLSITLREEGLEWATSESGKGGKRSHLLPE